MMPAPPAHLISAVSTAREAVRYLEGGRLLSSSADPERLRELLSPALFLLSHAMELSIKAPLILAKVNTRNHQHDFPWLLQRLDKLDVSVSASFSEAAEVMAPGHRHYHFRYPSSEGVSYYPPATLIERVEPDILALRAYVEERAERDFAGAASWFGDDPD